MRVKLLGDLILQIFFEDPDIKDNLKFLNPANFPSWINYDVKDASSLGILTGIPNNKI